MSLQTTEKKQKIILKPAFRCQILSGRPWKFKILQGACKQESSHRIAKDSNKRKKHSWLGHKGLSLLPVPDANMFM